MQIRTTLLAAAFLPALVCAQNPTVSVVSATDIGAMTDIGGTRTIQSVPVNSSIGAYPNSVMLMTSQSAPSTYASAHTIIYPTQLYQGSIGVNFFERAYARGASTVQAGTTAATVATGASFGGHGVLATFSAPPGTIGKVVLSFRNNPGTGGTVNATLDVGNDSTIELNTATAQTFEVPHTMGASGQIVVRLDQTCTVNGLNNSTTTNYAWTECWLGWRTDLNATATFTNYGTPCGANAMGGEVVLGQNRVITMVCTGAFANEPVLSVAGTQSASIPIPGGCNLLLNSIVVTGMVADATGTATATWTVPITLVGTAYHQFIPWRVDPVVGLQVSASNGVRLDLVR